MRTVKDEGGRMKDELDACYARLCGLTRDKTVQDVLWLSQSRLTKTKNNSLSEAKGPYHG